MSVSQGRRAAAHNRVFGVPYFRIVNAAFCHPHPLGSRFNSAERITPKVAGSTPAPATNPSFQLSRHAHDFATLEPSS